MDSGEKNPCSKLAKNEHLQMVGAHSSVFNDEPTASPPEPITDLDILLKRIGSQILTLRKSRKWSQATLASKAGLDRAYISSLENGKQNMSIGALLRIANALEVHFCELVVKRLST